jgi:hypothetical protein
VIKIALLGAGVFVRLGIQHGVAIPVNSVLVACIKGAEEAFSPDQHVISLALSYDLQFFIHS